MIADRIGPTCPRRPSSEGAAGTGVSKAPPRRVRREAERVALWDPEKLFCLRFQARRTVQSAPTPFHLHNPQVIISWDSVVCATASRSLLERRPRADARTCPAHSGRKLWVSVKCFMLHNLDINAAALFKVMKESQMNWLQRLFFLSSNLWSDFLYSRSSQWCVRAVFTDRKTLVHDRQGCGSILAAPRNTQTLRTCSSFFNHCTYKLVSLGCCEVFFCNYCGLK